MADGPAEVLKSAQSWLIISSLMLGGKGGFFGGEVKILRRGAPIAQREGFCFWVSPPEDLHLRREGDHLWRGRCYCPGVLCPCRVDETPQDPE